MVWNLRFLASSGSIWIGGSGFSKWWNQPSHGSEADLGPVLSLISSTPSLIGMVQGWLQAQTGVWLALSNSLFESRVGRRGLFELRNLEGYEGEGFGGLGREFKNIDYLFRSLFKYYY